MQIYITIEKFLYLYKQSWTFKKAESEIFWNDIVHIKLCMYVKLLYINLQMKGGWNDDKAFFF